MFELAVSLLLSNAIEKYRIDRCLIRRLVWIQEKLTSVVS